MSYPSVTLFDSYQFSISHFISILYRLYYATENAHNSAYNEGQLRKV